MPIKVDDTTVKIVEELLIHLENQPSEVVEAAISRINGSTVQILKSRADYEEREVHYANERLNKTYAAISSINVPQKPSELFKSPEPIQSPLTSMFDSEQKSKFSH